MGTQNDGVTKISYEIIGDVTDEQMRYGDYAISLLVDDVDVTDHGEHEGIEDKLPYICIDMSKHGDEAEFLSSAKCSFIDPTGKSDGNVYQFRLTDKLIALLMRNGEDEAYSTPTDYLYKAQNELTIASNLVAAARDDSNYEIAAPHIREFVILACKAVLAKASPDNDLSGRNDVAGLLEDASRHVDVSAVLLGCADEIDGWVYGTDIDVHDDVVLNVVDVCETLMTTALMFCDVDIVPMD